MTRQEYKAIARQRIQTVRPPVMFVTLAVVAVGWLFSLLEQRIGASPLYIDMGAVEAMDAENAFGVDWSQVTVAGVMISLAFRVMETMLDFGYVRYCLNVHREQNAGFSDLFSGFEFPGKAIGLWLLESILLSLLSLLFVVPAILAGYAWSMSRRLLCDHPDWTPVRCLRESRMLMRGHKWELFTLHLSFFGWFLLMGFIPAASVYVTPYLALTECGFYRILSGDGAPEEERPDDDRLPPWES